MKLPKRAVLLLALGCVLAVGALVWRSGSADEGGLFYRITTDLETEGQPFQLDVVVQCRGLEVVRSGGGGRLSYLQLPYLYGRPTPAGHAVLMRGLDLCGITDLGTEGPPFKVDAILQCRNWRGTGAGDGSSLSYRQFPL